MKKFLSRLMVVMMLIVPIGITSVTTGCATLPAQQQAVAVEYKTLSAVVNVVDIARGAYDMVYKVGRRGLVGEAIIVPQTTDDKIASIYLQYQKVGNLAIAKAKEQAAAANAGTTVTTNEYIAQLQDLINQLLTLFNQVPTMPAQAPVVITNNAGV